MANNHYVNVQIIPEAGEYILSSYENKLEAFITEADLANLEGKYNLHKRIYDQNTGDIELWGMIKVKEFENFE